MLINFVLSEDACYNENLKVTGLEKHQFVSKYQSKWCQSK